MQKQATRIRDRAIRRAGELLKQIEPARGANQNIHAGGGAKVLTRSDAAAAAGLSSRQKDTALQVASVPAVDFEAQVESDKPPTISALAEQGKKSAPKPVIGVKGEEFSSPSFPAKHQMAL